MSRGSYLGEKIQNPHLEGTWMMVASGIGRYEYRKMRIGYVSYDHHHPPTAHIIVGSDMRTHNQHMNKRTIQTRQQRRTSSSRLFKVIDLCVTIPGYTVQRSTLSV
jgi:hypothetical protein